MTDFDAFWAEWPKKSAKGRARKAFINALKIASFEEIMAGLERFNAAQPWKNDITFCPHPATWLNGEEWTNEYETPGSQIDDAIRERARNADRARAQTGGPGGGPDLRLVETPLFAAGFAASKK